MINITKLYCGVDTPGDDLRYGRKKTRAGKSSGSSSFRPPVVVWNITKRCNLNCVHCYSDSANKPYSGELSTGEAKKVLNNLADFKVPVILFSGGEPLLRKDIFSLSGYARSLGINCVLSTNGTLIDEKMAVKIKQSGFYYAGISLDGMEKTNDAFRGKKGAFKKSAQAFKNCLKINQMAGLRLTLTGQNLQELHKVFDFIEEYNIPRACFYHLVPSGRCSQVFKDNASRAHTRSALDIIMQRTQDFIKRKIHKDILTVDNPSDGIYIYLKLKEKKSTRAKEVLDLLSRNGGGRNSSGVGIGCIDYKGDVHPDQFWQDYSLGSVKDKNFSDIWNDTSDPLLRGLKNRTPLIKGRCSSCKWLGICGGGLRARAEKIYGDPWESDPACCLTDEEILCQKYTLNR